ncbi:flagellar hook-associated protein FlgK [Novosphingobium mangrovi (ex Hu et al. 2023)]|uniref:Flagellar hook-associated protein 1 n=1 Tax=Novosphingobium mangrovi (ex Hu et al. 2023) TaxID=2930094 RepID=A0ABT0AGA6_9SPHN|nr:flagellar hook-associated protein FlgK [Novosphingobium mangrovi (ex Hu et al. 2023)]MCJ1962236.1 flagellar hook-associated protein FlgK [Novosphingobium mangrovi (ex Hu et al. 2023)]
MPSDLISMARSGTRAARTALEITSNNIANASSEGYVRRSVSLAEVAVGTVSSTPTSINLAGVAVAGIVRNADQFRQGEVRRTGADAARAAAEVQGLENIESAVEQTGVYTSIVDFEAGLQALLSDPTDGPLRAGVLEQGRTLSETLNVAASSLDAVGDGLRFEAGEGVENVNRIATELARVNLRLSRASDSSSDQTAQLDQRDMLLQELSQYVDTRTSFAPDTGVVTVTLGGPSGTDLVDGGATRSLAMATAADGTVSFTLDGTPTAISSGQLAGKSLSLTQAASTRAELDAIAAEIVTTVNAAQAAGVDLDGNPGQPLFSGTGAADMRMIAANGAAVATAPAGAGANSRDVSNLEAMRSALSAADPAGDMDTLLFGISSAVAGRRVTRDALDSIASTARVALQAQAGVDLDQEAVNLVRFQQAFEANARVMQVATDIFDSILAIR